MPCGQTAPVRPAEFERVFRGDVLPGETDIEHVADQRNLRFGQCGNDCQWFDAIVIVPGGRIDQFLLLLFGEGIMAGEKTRNQPGQPDGNRETQDNDGSGKKSRMGDVHINRNMNQVARWSRGVTQRRSVFSRARNRRQLIQRRAADRPSESAPSQETNHTRDSIDVAHPLRCHRRLG